MSFWGAAASGAGILLGLLPGMCASIGDSPKVNTTQAPPPSNIEVITAPDGTLLYVAPNGVIVCVLRPHSTRCNE